MLTEVAAEDERGPYRARMAGGGPALPPARLTTAELMRSPRHRTRIDLEHLTGIRERRVATEDDSLGLAVGAARDCLARAGRRAEDVELLVSCSITKYRDGLVHWLEPTTAAAVARAIGAGRAVTFDVANACAGTLTGVAVANNWVRRGEVRCALVVSGERISGLGTNAARHVRSMASRELASLTLGDAGAAVLVGRAGEGEPGPAPAGFTTVAGHRRPCPPPPPRPGPGAPRATRPRAAPPRAAPAPPPPPSVRAIRTGMRTVAAALGATPRNPPVVTVDRYGNTASTTHVVALVEELDAGRLRAGDRVALVALASGLEIGVVLFTVDPC